MRRVLHVPAFGEEGDVAYADSETDAIAPAAAATPVPPTARTRLPPTGPPPPKPSLWSILKRVAGAPAGTSLIDLPLPVSLCEPLTEVQRRCEIVMTGAPLLDRAAAAARGSVDRALALAAYVVTTYSVTTRTTKCLPPLLGETCEWGGTRGDTNDDPSPSTFPYTFLVEMTLSDKRVGAVASAWAGAGRGWRCAGDDSPRVALKGAGLEFDPGWRDRVEFEDGDVYEWGRVREEGRGGRGGRDGEAASLSSLNPRPHTPSTHQAKPTLVGLVSGRNAVSYSGRVVIAPAPDARPSTDAPPSLTAVLAFQAPSVMAALKGGDSVPHGVTGWLEHASGRRVEGVTLVGDWSSFLFARGGSDGAGPDRELWRATPVAPGAPFDLSGVAAALNDGRVVAAPGVGALPPTDSRRRPDVVALEAGDWDTAQTSLDTLQAADAARARRGDHTAAWFRPVAPRAPDRGGGGGGDAARGPLRWECTGEYWGCRERGDWGRCAAL